MKKKCIQYECEKEIAVLGLGGNMTELNNECVPVDATSHGSRSILLVSQITGCDSENVVSVLNYLQELKKILRKDSDQVSSSRCLCFWESNKK